VGYNVVADNSLLV